MNPTRQAIVEALSELFDLFPDWRFGQAVGNITDLAPRQDDPRFPGVGDIEDEEFLAVLRSFVEQRKNSLRQSNGSSHETPTNLAVHG